MKKINYNKECIQNNEDYNLKKIIHLYTHWDKNSIATEQLEEAIVDYITAELRKLDFIRAGQDRITKIFKNKGTCSCVTPARAISEPYFCLKCSKNITIPERFKKKEIK